MTDPTRNLLFCAAALLEQGRTVDRLSRPLTVAAFVGILIYPAIMGPAQWVLIGFVTLAALFGLAETYLAVRVGFDAALFRGLAGAPGAPDFGGTDTALSQLGLLPAARAGRPAEARVAGARRLFGLQSLALVTQVVCLLAGACIAMIWR